MKIRKLIIKNYKIFDDVEFDFTDAEGKTLDTVVLAGVNGCGKTTVLEAVSKFLTGQFLAGELGKSKIEIGLTMTQTEWSVLRNRPGWSPILGIRFVGDPISRDRNLETRPLRVEMTRQGLSDFNEVMLVRHPNSYGSEHGIYFPAKKHEKVFKNAYPYMKIGEISQNLKGVRAKSLKIARDEVFKNKDLPPRQVIDNQIQHLVSALSGLDLNTRLVDLESEELVFESANGQRIYFEQLSHGEQHLYFRAIYLSQLNLKDSIIMVDEPEAAFHPTWQQKIAQLYRNVGENNQVFMATHSPHIMASVPPECLFVLHIEEVEGKRRIRVVNAAKAGKHTQGLEPNRILKEVMQVETLRDWQTQRDMERLTALLTPEQFDGTEAENLVEKLTGQLGRQDPFIIRLEHQLLMLRRKKGNHAPAYAAA